MLNEINQAQKDKHFTITCGTQKNKSVVLLEAESRIMIIRCWRDEQRKEKRGEVEVHGWY